MGESPAGRQVVIAGPPSIGARARVDEHENMGVVTLRNDLAGPIVTLTRKAGIR